ncbi:DNA topoisomerase 3-alpha isoform X1 [Magallana gigas]|uniref:DNA topoisomerase 3-alpha isoform X1 n=1 Tax=Magallana gigas TaxID=29159 RepID=UPI0033420A05
MIRNFVGILIRRKYCSYASADMVKVLNVAEKNDAAKTIANVISRGSAKKREGFSKFNKIYEFNYNILNKNCLMMMTSVSGHLLEMDFVGQYNKWYSCSPLSLFDLPIEKKCPDKFADIKRTLEREVRQSQYLIIWTDCDREGENIGHEVIQVCKAVNPNIPVYRARFSEITPQAVARACSNLVPPDQRTSDAVDVRQELDLRIGAAFTRFQTMRLQKIFPEALADKLISYGSCQFPTLGFVVERYKQVQAFIPEPFWKIKVTHMFDEETKCEFSWKRNRLFDHNACLILYEQCVENPQATVMEVKCKPKSKWRPTPLDTVEMEKLASRKLRLSAKETMRIAENLYTKGFISYPRTETNIFPKDLDLAALVQEQSRDPNWGGFASGILQDRPNPRNGNKSDQAHPPIHPIKYTATLQGNDARLYEFIVRHFLATCSKDAQGQETTVTINIADEMFTAQGLMIIARNYLDVYPYDRWNAKTIPVYQEGDSFQPNSIDMLFSETSPPPLLTEADLIALMEKHGIGTDATHAEHIETIKTRMYIGVNNDGRFVPGQLGMGLVEGYDAMGYEMSKPHLRSELEADLKRICEGKKDKNVVLTQQVAKYRDVFKVACEQALKIDQALSQYLGEAKEIPVGEELERLSVVPVKKCSNCGLEMTLKTKKSGGFYIGCQGYPSCRSAIWFPDFVLDASVSDVKCETCQAHLVNFKFKMGSVPPMLPLEYAGCVAGCDELLAESLQINHSAPPSSQRPTQQMMGGHVRQESQRVPLVTVQPFNRQTDNQESAGQEVVCNCGTSALLLTVKKDGPNQGRQFYKCGGSVCNFFLWADESQNNTLNNSRGPPVGGGGVNSRGPSGGGGGVRGGGGDRFQNPGPEVTCNCGGPARLLRVTKEGPNKDREFYSCSLPRGQGCDFFQWADATDENGDRSFRGGGGGGQQGITNNGNQEVMCNCGTQAKLLTVNKEGPNKGRTFYACANPRDQSCNFFQWGDVTNDENRGGNLSGGGGDQGTHSGGDSDVMCNCGNPAKMLTVNKEGPNKGRTFYACANPREQSCNFFQWADVTNDENSGGQFGGGGGGGGSRYQGTQSGGDSDVMCNCGNPAKMLMVNKEGPNKGRTFYACANPRDQSCKFFQWADESSSGGNTNTGVSKKRTLSMLDSSGVTPTKKRAARKCGLCGEEGHTKRTCPHK